MSVGMANRWVIAIAGTVVMVTIGCLYSWALFTQPLLVAYHWLALLATSVVLFCCGGGFGTMPSFNAGCFGTIYMGLNYALILTAWGFAALVGPTLVARAKDMTGSFAGMLPLIALLLAGAVILPFLTKKPSRRLLLPKSCRPSVYESLDTIPSGEFR